MPAKDLYHDAIKAALTKDGWTITDDPLTLRWGPKDLFVDLGAEKLLTAEKAGRKIAVEIKSFLGQSDVEDLRNALGQYVLYQQVLEEVEPDREIYLAIHHGERDETRASSRSVSPARTSSPRQTRTGLSPDSSKSSRR